MNTAQISIRNVNPNDHILIVDYFLLAEPDHLLRMGVDAKKLYERENWLHRLNENYHQKDDKKQFFYLIWLLEGNPIGHCNINKIIPGQEAYLHLHLWSSKERQKGLGLYFLQLSIPIFFNVFKLQRLFCEPYALNPAPNKTLAKLGFDFLATYETTPGIFNFPQLVNRWCMEKESLGNGWPIK